MKTVMEQKAQSNRMALLAALLTLTLLLSCPGFVFTPRAASAETAAQPTWEQAFESMYQQLVTEYAFTEWKHLDWASLHDTYLPLIQKAQAEQDFNAYYIALREFLTEIPDGHVSITSLKDIDDLYIGGGFGFAVTRLSDDTVIVYGGRIQPRLCCRAARRRRAYGMERRGGFGGSQAGENHLCGSSATTELAVQADAVPYARTVGQRRKSPFKTAPMRLYRPLR
jgi:hypothetical protein